ncbi:MAG TPA: DUF1932 domain-containing protein [Hyphomicrobiaceae bacterium]|nr:DUF1932 domain-containing protein [Hyphomicrobiaceae bacterium]
MSKPIVAIIAAGNMGAAVAARLTQAGVTVLTSLVGRSSASEERARVAGMRAASDAEIASADVILSVLPPRDAMGLVKRLSPAIKSSGRKPIYVDGNAVSPATVEQIGAVATEAGARFVDGAIIGPPPKADGSSRTILYVSGEHADQVLPLGKLGIEVRKVAGGVGAASALKMSYAAVTKGLTALGTASLIAASEAGVAEELRRELEESQPAVLAFLTRGVPDMCPKAYRWVNEMEEVGTYTGRPAGNQIYKGIAALYQGIADDMAGGRTDVRTLEDFFTSAKRR